MTLTFDGMTPKTIGVLLIWYITHVQSLKDLCRKAFELSQHKVKTDGWRTDDVITIGHPHFQCPNKLPVTLTFDVMTPKTISVLLIIYITHIQSLKVLCRKALEISQHKESVDGRTNRRTDRRCDYYRTPAFFNAGPYIMTQWAKMPKQNSHFTELR